MSPCRLFLGGGWCLRSGLLLFGWCLLGCLGLGGLLLLLFGGCLLGSLGLGRLLLLLFGRSLLGGGLLLGGRRLGSLLRVARVKCEIIISLKHIIPMQVCK